MVGAVALVLAASACSGDEVASPTRTVPPGTQATTTTTTAPVLDCAPTTPVVPPEGKPTVTVPEGAAPTTLQSTDIKVGDGVEAKVGDTVKMQYVGVSKTTGKEFDASWTRNAEPFEFTLGPTAQVIQGWNQGIGGMKVGGRRQLVIPPDLAYGAEAKGENIAANDTLVFIVDLVQVCTPQTPGTTPATAAPASIPPADASTTVAPTTAAPTATTATTTAPATTTSAAGATTTTTAAATTTTAAR